MSKNIQTHLRHVFPYQDEKIEVLIDGSNLFATSKSLGLVIDFAKLQKFLAQFGKLVRISYYTAMLTTDEHNPLKPLVDWLSYNGYNLVLKDAKQFTDVETGTVTTKGNVDVDLAVDAMKAAEYVDHIILFTGDGDFKALVHALQERRVRVTAISSVQTKPAMCADELRKQVDSFIDLQDLRQYIEKTRG